MSHKPVYAQSAGDPAVPARLGNYEIRGILGRGQSATIYLGRELFPARDVAIKVYDAHHLDPEDRKVFPRSSSRRRSSRGSSRIPTSPRSTTRLPTTTAPIS